LPGLDYEGDVALLGAVLSWFDERSAHFEVLERRAQS
jgi:hypothetical protein